MRGVKLELNLLRDLAEGITDTERHVVTYVSFMFRRYCSRVVFPESVAGWH